MKGIGKWDWISPQILSRDGSNTDLMQRVKNAKARATLVRLGLHALRQLKLLKIVLL
jgi:hypothetical protein